MKLKTSVKVQSSEPEGTIGRDRTIGHVVAGVSSGRRPPANPPAYRDDSPQERQVYRLLLMAAIGIAVLCWACGTAVGLIVATVGRAGG